MTFAAYVVAACGFAGFGGAPLARHAPPRMAVEEPEWRHANAKAPHDAATKVAEGVLAKNAAGGPWVEQRARPRRNRKSEAMRSMAGRVVARRSWTT